MYSKIIQPSKDGKLVYSNRGSCLQLQNYLAKELKNSAEKEGDSTKIFFNAEGVFNKNEAVELIDKNVKGLGNEKEKFYSLVINPSEKELAHIGNNDNSLKAFTIDCMKNYAENFNIKNKKLIAKDLVWVATIHHNRTYKGNDKEVLNGTKKQGETKDGLHTHIHITVSARDKEQKITLNPQSKNRFVIVDWATKNQEAYCQKFNYIAPKQDFGNNKARINQVNSILRKLEKIGFKEETLDSIRHQAREKKYSSDFHERLKSVFEEVKKDKKNDLNQEQKTRLNDAKNTTKNLSTNGFEHETTSAKFYFLRELLNGADIFGMEEDNSLKDNHRKRKHYNQTINSQNELSK